MERRGIAATAVAVTAALGVDAVWLLSVPLREAGRAHYDVPAAGLVGVSVAALLTAGGAWAIIARPHRSVALLSLLATALVGVGVLAILSVGVVFLAAGLVVVGLTLRRARADD